MGVRLLVQGVSTFPAAETERSRHGDSALRDSDRCSVAESRHGHVQPDGRPLPRRCTGERTASGHQVSLVCLGAPPAGNHSEYDETLAERQHSTSYLGCDVVPSPWISLGIETSPAFVRPLHSIEVDPWTVEGPTQTEQKVALSSARWFDSGVCSSSQASPELSASPVLCAVPPPAIFDELVPRQTTSQNLPATEAPPFRPDGLLVSGQEAGGTPMDDREETPSGEGVLGIDWVGGDGRRGDHSGMKGGSRRGSTWSCRLEEDRCENDRCSSPNRCVAAADSSDEVVPFHTGTFGIGESAASDGWSPQAVDRKERNIDILNTCKAEEVF